MLLLIATVVFVYYTAEIDAQHILKKEFIDRSRKEERFLQRATVAAIIMTFSFWSAIGFALLFWALFDATLNNKRSLGIWYLGTESNTDIFFKDNLLIYKISKVVSLLLGLFLI